MCANCHSFSADGKTWDGTWMGCRATGGMYILAPVAPQMSVNPQAGCDSVSSLRESWKETSGVGFMSQVHPTDIRGDHGQTPASMLPLRGTPSNYYVANFKDYRFLQVFYPTAPGF